MLFTIIIPIYNVEKYLEKCLLSIIPQYDDNIEIILIDDGSPDHCPIICDDYCSNYPFIRVIHQNNSGLSQARNAGIKEAKGKYCIFLDGDDWLANEAIKNLSKILTGKTFDIIVNRIKLYSENSNVLSDCRYLFDTEKLENMSISQAYNSINSMKGFWGAAWMFVVRTDFIREQNLYFSPGIFHEDEDWVPRVFLNATSVHYNNEYLYCLRLNRVGSITQMETPRHEIDKLWIIKHLLSEMRKEHYNVNQKNLILLRCCKLYVGIIRKVALYSKVYPDDYRTVLTELTELKPILNQSGNSKYRALYWLLQLLGVSKAAKLLMLR